MPPAPDPSGNPETQPPKAQPGTAATGHAGGQGTARDTVATILDDQMTGRRSAGDIIARIFRDIPAIEASLNPFAECFRDSAMEAARAADRARAEGRRTGPLHGVPVAIKDMTPSAGHRTTRGSWTSGEALTSRSAVIVERLEQAGAIIIAKTTTAELAWSSFTATPRHGVTRNPWDASRTSGGSSGGAAVAVATGLVPLAEGSDMGGSVRIPAAACGVIGFKPSLGRIPMEIMPSALETFSHFGPLAATIDDAVRFLEVTSGPHPLDMLSHRPAFDVQAARPGDLAGKRIALSMDLGYCAVDPEISRIMTRTADMLARQGAEIEEVELPWTREVFDLWAVRWDCLLALWPGADSAEMKARMDPGLVESMERGRRTLAMDLLGVDVLRRKMNADLCQLFENRDALICPTNAIPAPPADACDTDFGLSLPDGRIETFDMAHPFNMVPSCPALSLPVGRVPSGLPAGMQIVGPPFADEATLALAGAIEALAGLLPLPRAPLPPAPPPQTLPPL